ncbi:MAG: 1,4-alpha-glucan branching protein GlgB, partial [Acholeplasmatales bacterium]|nr:1,4-alpha-glucan branching protein GlgB [Acholeplasmatales bacterium]
LGGVWYCYLEGQFEWQRYKYLIITKQGEHLYKADPYAFYSQVRPSQDSKVYDIEGYKWNDNDWCVNHKKTYDQPMMIYEMHVGSWKRKEDGSFYTFAELAPMLIDYLKQYGFTHVELMPVYDYPLDASWGYQGTGYYAITPRYGVPKDLMYLIDMLHQNNFGVILDWVPGHTCKDSFGLYRFDGTYLYDYESDHDRENEWGTANLNLGKGITKSFFYSDALFYLNYFHVDGFRLDAVGNMVYWQGNMYHGENKDAREFLQNLSKILFKKDDRVLFIAEDSTTFPNVTKPVSSGGLGFNYKWDMGWMNDTLKYFKLDPIYRSYHHNQLTFSMMYYYNEQFLLPFSHDEVVHMKGSLLNKMPGDEWKKFANYRCMIGYMMTHPGKKLLFMGDELATYDEWHYESELPWSILKYPTHDSANRFFKELSLIYKNEKSLWENEYGSTTGFEYVDADNKNLSLYSYIRYAKNWKDHILVVMNCTPNTYDNFRVGCKEADQYVELINSDRDIYGGSNRVNPLPIKVEKIPQNGRDYSISITVPPLGITLLKAKFLPKKKTKK